MKLYYYCSSKSCQKKNTIKVNSNNRYDLKTEIGDEINERCKYCGNFTKRHINRLHAEINYINIIAAILVMIIVNVFFYGGLSLLISSSFPIFIWMNEVKKASAFNKVMI